MRLVVTLACLVFSVSLRAQPSANYYDSVDLGSVQALKTSLHNIIDDHTRIPYTSTATDTWDIINSADEDPLNSGNVLTIYKNASYPKVAGGNDNYNREHSWPKSYGFPKDAVSNYPYTDLHHLFAADSSYNSSRNNLPYGTCDASCLEKATNAYNGEGGTTGIYPGESNWREGSGSTGTWEVWEDRRGDIARAMFYMALRYEGGTHNVTGAAEPDLELTDDLDLIAASNTGANEATGYMGRLTDLLAWHEADPVDDLERARNDVVEASQGNRNPFIDRPAYVGYIFGGKTLSQTTIGGVDLTAEPLYLNATYLEDPRILEPEILVSGVLPVRYQFNLDGIGLVSQETGSGNDVDLDVFNWQIDASSNSVALTFTRGTGDYTLLYFDYPPTDDSNPSQDAILTFTEKFGEATLQQLNELCNDTYLSCQVGIERSVTKVVLAPQQNGLWQVDTTTQETLLIPENIVNAGWVGENEIQAPPTTSMVDHFAIQSERDLLSAYADEDILGEWVLPMYLDESEAESLKVTGLFFPDRFTFQSTDDTAGGTAVSERTGLTFNWVLDGNTLKLSNDNRELRYVMLDRQDDIALFDFEHIDVNQGASFTVASRGAKFDGTGTNQVANIELELPLYYQSLLNGKPGFTESPGTCDRWVGGILFYKPSKATRLFGCPEGRPTTFGASGPVERNVEKRGDMLVLSGYIGESRYVERRWTVVSTMEDGRLLVIESSWQQFLDEAFQEVYGPDIQERFANRVFVIEKMDLSLTGDAWLLADFDNDGLTNAQEDVAGTGYGDPDSDADGFSDGSDNCPALSNGQQVNTDSDAQGNVCDSDDDNDGLTDEQEATLGTNPLKTDTDTDGWSDKEEVDEGTDPLSVKSQPDISTGLPIWLLYEATKTSTTAVKISISADERYELFIDGVKLLSGIDWKTAETTSINLFKGRHVLAVKGYNDANGTHPGAIIVDMRGPNLNIVSDSTWEQSITFTDDWNALDGTLSDSQKVIEYGDVYSPVWWNRDETDTSGASLENSNFPLESGAHWIWSEGLNTDSEVYFRKEFFVQ